MKRPGVHSPAVASISSDPVLPLYGSGSIADVMPAVLDSLVRARPGEAGLVEARARMGSRDPSRVTPGSGRRAQKGTEGASEAEERRVPGAGWMPDELMEASKQVVLLVVDGLGWNQLARRRELAPFIGSGRTRITSALPSTTATALTTITTGRVPAEHGMLGYRIKQEDEQVMNVLRWCSGDRDLRQQIPAMSFQPLPAFGGLEVPVVSRSDFGPTGFTAAHLGVARLHGWRVPSGMLVQVPRLVSEGYPLVYAYYDGIDKVAHEWGLGAEYEEELAFVDRLVADLVERLPRDTTLVLTADHGHVEVDETSVVIETEIMSMVSMLSGEGRFRWLHARSHGSADLEAACREAFGHLAWVMTPAQMEAAGWFGGKLRPEFVARLGDVALVARDPVAFLDPADTGESRLLGRHGSCTDEEMWVPLLSWRGREGGPSNV